MRHTSPLPLAVGACDLLSLVVFFSATQGSFRPKKDGFCSGSPPRWQWHARCTPQALWRCRVGARLAGGFRMAVGLVVVGLGNVGSSLLAGIEAARAHLVHPWGTLAEAGGTARTAGRGGPEPLRARVPLAELSELVLGAFEVRDDDAYHAALRAGLLDRSLVDELRPRLRQIRAMSGARHAPTRRHLADALAEDLRGFLEHGGCQRGIVVCTAPGLRELAGKPPFTTQEVWTALEKSDADVTPGLVYSAAPAQAGCSFVAAPPHAAL